MNRDSLLQAAAPPGGVSAAQLERVPPPATTCANPARSAAARAINAYMIAVGILGNGIFYLQAYSIFATKSAQAVSLPAFVIAFWASASWLAYGVYLRNKVIVVAYLLSVVGSALVIAGKLLYS